MRVALVVAALLLVAAPARAAVTEARPGGVTVDWSAGRILASGAAAADPRAPDAEVARVTAERLALERARGALGVAARAMALAEGGTVGEKAAADAAIEARLVAAVGRARAVSVSYASDGGARVTAALPIEALRLAVTPATPPAADDSAPTAIVIEVAGAGAKPVLGLRIAAAGTAGGVALPTVWLDGGVAAAEKDTRAGARVVKGKAAGKPTGGVLAVDVPAKTLEMAAAAGTLIIVVTR